MSASTPTGNWHGVLEIESGQQIKVVLHTDGPSRRGRIEKGRFASANEDQLTITATDSAAKGVS